MITPSTKQQNYQYQVNIGGVDTGQASRTQWPVLCRTEVKSNGDNEIINYLFAEDK